ncbi:MAG: hypothetical protein JST27_03005 [Bacteroidetes bacterium]|nr:hypothetical protein [Bacteroidota bacterium]
MKAVMKRGGWQQNWVLKDWKKQVAISERKQLIRTLLLCVACLYFWLLMSI